MRAQLPIKLLTSFGALALLAFLASGCVFGGGDDSTPGATPPANASATAEPSASPRVPTATPSPTVSAELPPGLEATTEGTWQHVELAVGDPVPDVLGAFLFDVESGVGTLWSLEPSTVSNPDYVFIEPTLDGNYVVARGDPNHLVNTATGRSFTWGWRTRLARVDDSGRALFQAPDRCVFWLADLSGEQPEPVAAFVLAEGRRCFTQTRVAPDGSRLLVAAPGNSSDGGVDLYSVDLDSGQLMELGRFDPTYLLFADSPRDDVALLGGPSQGAAWLGVFDWSEGTLTTEVVETGEPRSATDKDDPEPNNVTPSPDGRWLAWAESADIGVAQGAGGINEWPVTVIASADGSAPSVVAQRVALSNGIVSADWLPDSSGIVAQSEDGFAILGTDGSWKPLPFAMARHSDPIPLPAPDGSGRFAYDGRVVSAAGELQGDVPAVADAWGRGDEVRPTSWWIRTRYAWSSDGDRLILVRTEIPGGDFGRGGVATMGLPAHVTVGERSASGEIQLQVAAGGDRLNARAAPGIAAERIGQFEDGTTLTIARDRGFGEGGCGLDGCSIVSDPDLDYDDGWWIYVSGEGTEGDLAGWVTAEFLAWPDEAD